MRTSKTLVLLLALALGIFALGGCDGADPADPYGDTGGDTGGSEEDMTDGDSPMADPSTPATGGAGMMSDNTILAHSLAFAPSTLKVSVGEDVTFTNGDDTAHEVEIGGETIGRMEHGESLTWTPDAPGTYDFVCPLHPEMTGTIVVE